MHMSTWTGGAMIEFGLGQSSPTKYRPRWLRDFFDFFFRISGPRKLSFLAITHSDSNVSGRRISRPRNLKSQNWVQDILFYKYTAADGSEILVFLGPGPRHLPCIYTAGDDSEIFIPSIFLTFAKYTKNDQMKDGM